MYFFVDTLLLKSFQYLEFFQMCDIKSKLSEGETIINMVPYYQVSKEAVFCINILLTNCRVNEI